MNCISDGEAIVDSPQRLCDVVPVQILLAIVPAYRVQTVLDLKHHCGEGAYCGQVALPVYGLVVCVEHEGCIRPILLVKSTEDQDG